MNATSRVYDALPWEVQRELEIIGDDYEYPDGLDLRPGSKLHDDTVAMVLDLAKRGYAATDEAIPEYDKISKVMEGYMPADQVDNLRKLDDSRKEVNVVIPMLYSHDKLLLTAMHRAYFYGEQFHRYAGPGSPERAAKAALATKLMGRISTWFSEREKADIHWGDAFGFGKAYMWGKWSKRTAPALVTERADFMLVSALRGMGVTGYEVNDMIRFLDDSVEQRREGTEWQPIDPYQCLPDPDTPPTNFQDSSFFGWTVRTNAMLLYGMEEDPEEELFNCRALMALARAGVGKSSCYREHTSGKERMGGTDDTPITKFATPCDVIYMFARIIPRWHNLGESKKPQIWFFAVGGDRILIKAGQVRTRHGGIPVVCSAPNRRGHEINPVSNLGITLGQQISVDMLVKQRLDFQDMVKNGKFVIDPQYLEWRDFKKGGGPMVVRLKKRAIGKNISELYHQMSVEDVTQGNWNDVANLINLAREGGGITEPASDMPDRPTAVGIDAIQGRSIGRMARIALLIDEQSRREMAYQHVCNTAQYMSTDVILDIIGRDEQIVRQGYGLPPGATGLIVSGWDVDPDLDVVALSAFSNGGHNMSAMTEFAKTLMGAPGALEALFKSYRIEEFLTAYFREMGIPDIDWYRAIPSQINVTPMTNEAILAGQQAGTLVPMSSVAPGAMGAAA